MRQKDTKGSTWNIQFSEPIKSSESISVDYSEKEWTDDDMEAFANNLGKYWDAGHSTKSALNEFKKLKL